MKHTPFSMLSSLRSKPFYEAYIMAKILGKPTFKFASGIWKTNDSKIKKDFLRDLSLGLVNLKLYSSSSHTKFPISQESDIM